MFNRLRKRLRDNPVFKLFNRLLGRSGEEASLVNPRLGERYEGEFVHNPLFNGGNSDYYVDPQDAKTNPEEDETGYATIGSRTATIGSGTEPLYAVPNPEEDEPVYEEIGSGAKGSGAKSLYKPNLRREIESPYAYLDPKKLEQARIKIERINARDEPLYLTRADIAAEIEKNSESTSSLYGLIDLGENCGKQPPTSYFQDGQEYLRNKLPPGGPLTQTDTNISEDVTEEELLEDHPNKPKI